MPDRYAVIGHPISHSKSPLIHTAFARQTGQDLVYTAIEGPLGGFERAVDAFRAEGARGLNITTPFKLDAFRYADERSDGAAQAGAANCIKFEGKRAYAENFDGIGLVRDVEHNLGVPLAGRSVLMLGAGGAARGAVQPLLDCGPSRLVLVNRTLEKARALARDVKRADAIEALSYQELDGRAFDVVINATSASQSDALPPLPARVFEACSLAYEMVYGRGLTPFLKLARSGGAARLADGVGMLVEQAAEAFAWWRGVRPDTRPVIQAFTVPLA